MLNRSNILLLIMFVLLTATALSLPSQDPESLKVGKGGIELFPRWNKAFKPLAEIKEGEVLTVLRERGSWKQVEVKSLEKKGWVFCEIETAAAPAGELKLPIAATPATSGLVAKGFSADLYANKNGTDTNKVNSVMNRQLNFDRFESFIRNGGLK